MDRNKYESGFNDLTIKRSYRLPNDDFIKDFLNPVLTKSCIYKRAVGFFTSKSLYQITIGLQNFVKNEGKMQLIVSTRLSSEDIEAISLGYKKRDEVIGNRLLETYQEPENIFEKERLNLICSLIENGILDIKVACPRSDSINAMYHEKLGIVTDNKGVSIAFTGSMNDSENAYYENYESVDVYSEYAGEQLRVSDKKNDFDKMWNNSDDELYVVEFPKLLIRKIETHKKDEVMIDIDKQQFSLFSKKRKIAKPKNIKVREYQRNAINAFKENGYVGIFDMATGTGKTYTSLIAMTEMYHELDEQLSIVICAPYKHLVLQWVEDLKQFGFEPIIAFSNSPDKNWKNKLHESVFRYNYGIKKPFCLICVNNTFMGNFVQEVLSNVIGDMLLVVDEAHNFGTPRLLKTLTSKFKYRLALSATLERHNDEIGTKKILEYFHKKCIEYSLEDAINNEFLTEYYYFPIPIELSEDEQLEYDEITKKIVKNINYTKEGKIRKPLSKVVERLLLKRARIVAGAKNKIPALVDNIKKYKDDSHMLIYCGATNVKIDEFDSEGQRQIVTVSKILHEEYGMRISHFTANESTEEREIIIKEFSRGTNIQAIAAIKCLDEGVNIPAIKTAFILASTTNPKEYIQRRGRVLRLFPGKNFATIYDFITLPNSETQYKIAARGLITRELKRVEEFGSMSINYRDTIELLTNIEKEYEIMGGINDEFI